MVRARDSGAQTSTSSSSPSAPAGDTILVVEDEESVRIMLGRLLRSQGYSIVLAANAVEARTVLSRLRPDLVVTDIIMPGENGIELRRGIAGMFPDLPVILISGFSDDGPAEFAARTPYTWFMPKPFATEQFLSLVESTLTQMRQPGEGP